MKYLFFLLVFIASCVSEKKILKRTVRQQILFDTSFVKLEVPLREMSHYRDAARQELRDSNILIFIKEFLGKNSSYSEYGISEKAKLFLSDIYYSPLDSSVLNAAFNFYKLQRLIPIKYAINPTNDTAFVTVQIDYYVTPIFQIPENPKFLTFKAIKQSNKWLFQNMNSLSYNMYNNDGIGPMNWLKVIFPKQVIEWREKLNKK